MKLTYCQFLLMSICLFGCSSALSHRDSFLAFYRQGNLPIAEANLTATIKKEIPCQDFRKSNDSVWLLLDRATTRFAMGDTEGAIADYRLSIDAIDFYNKDIPGETVQRLLFQDELGAYPGEDYEQVLARIYFALTLLHQGDRNNAFALLRQAEEIQQRKREMYRNIPFAHNYQLVDNSLGKYLFAALLETRGDFSNAEILYRQTAELVGSERVHSALPPVKQNLPSAKVIVICHNGNSPVKISTTSDASVASAAALEMILASRNIDPAWSSLTGIPVPALMQYCWDLPRPTAASVDGVEKPLIPWYDVAATAHFQLNQKMPAIVARGVARLLLRRTAVGCLQNQDPCVGALADMAMFVVNASTKADTRSWTTLPSSIDLNRFDVEPGLHYLDIKVASPAGLSYSARYELNLRQDDLCVVNIFNIYPGQTLVQIPKRFTVNKGEIP